MVENSTDKPNPLLNEALIQGLLGILEEVIVKPKYEYIYVYPITVYNFFGMGKDGFKVEGAYKEEFSGITIIELFNKLGKKGWSLIDPGNVNATSYNVTDSEIDTCRHSDYLNDIYKLRHYIFQRKITTRSEENLDILMDLLNVEVDRKTKNTDDDEKSKDNLDEIKKVLIEDIGLGAEHRAAYEAYEIAKYGSFISSGVDSNFERQKPKTAEKLKNAGFKTVGDLCDNVKSSDDLKNLGFSCDDYSARLLKTLNDVCHLNIRIPISEIFAGWSDESIYKHIGKILKENGINYLDELCKMSREEVINMGIDSPYLIEDLTWHLKCLGFYLYGEDQSE